MIVELLLSFAFVLLSLLTAPINLPDLPQGVLQTITTYLQYLTDGLVILDCYVDLQYLLVLFGLIVLVDVALLLYKAIMWFIKKIPMLNIK
jgi:hypothetical protein